LLWVMIYGNKRWKEAFFGGTIHQSLELI